MPNNNSESDSKERRIRNMLGLVKFCLESTAKEDATGNCSSGIEPMDSDRRAWLQQAISNMTIDTTRQLLENLSLVKETICQLQKDPNHNISLQKTCDAIEVLTDLCEDIDYASDFAKLDGFSIFKPLISCTHEELIVKACELIAALAQNNPLCQHIAMNTRLLEHLISFVDTRDNQKYIKARSYALYAISSIIRSNQEVRMHFEKHLDGLSVLLHVLDYQKLDQMIGLKQSTSISKTEENKSSSVYWWRKLRIRSVFLFRALCSESENASRYFYEAKAIKQLSEQLKNTKDDEIREHLLFALKAFLTSLDTQKQVESLKLIPDLKSVVEQIFASSDTGSSGDNDNYDMTETRSVCQELIKLIESLESQN